MADRLTVERSSCRALSVYLQTELDAVFGAGGSVVSERWPAPDETLPERAVTIVMTGERDDTFTVEPADHIVAMVPDAIDPTLGLYTFMVKACRQHVQLDVWAHYDLKRDELLFWVNDALNKGSDHTLGLGLRGGDPVRDGPLLALDPQYGFAGVVDFTFQGPSITDEPDAARQREYRASMSGTFDVNLTVQAKTLRLAQASVRSSLGTFRVL